MVLASLAFDGSSAQAQGKGEKEAVRHLGPDVWALTGARIVVAPGRVLEKGTLVLADGRIEAVGADVPVPPGAREMALEGKTLYPGLIDTYLPRAWPEEKFPPQGGSPRDRVTPERDLSLHAFEPGLAKAHRQAGFTTALVVPSSGVIRGQSALINLGDGGLAENLLRNRVAQHWSVESTRERGVYGRSLMGATALVRQTVLDARWYGRARASESGRRIPFDRSLEALVPALTKEQPSVFETEGFLDSLRAGRLARELGLKLWLVGNGHEYKRLREIATLGSPILLPLAFPDAPEVGKEGNDLSVKLEDLRHWDRAPDNPAALLDAGITVAFTTFRLAAPKDLFKHLAAAKERGLSEERILASLTTVPAKLLGISKQAGTLESGKTANLLVVEGELWQESPKILDVWIDGRRYPLRSGEAPALDPRGEWELTLELGDGPPPTLLLRLAGTPAELSGQVEAGPTEIGPIVLDLSSASLAGDRLEVVYDGAPVGAPGAVTLELTIDGDAARGKGTGPSGEFGVRGKRTAGPGGGAQ
ncbi:MAG: amidohydrolase family protein [Acidobacteria bacterium]|nr:amidohydrolase family protein [Acidobacteriota bacterium]